MEIMTFLDQEDLYNASLVNKRWTCVTLDPAIWDYDGEEDEEEQDEG